MTNERTIMKGKTLRFVNFLLDTAIYLSMMIAFFMIFRNTIGKENVRWISVLCYFLYYFLFEYYNGQTLAKKITQSKVVPLPIKDGNYFMQILLRTIMRFIPLDMLSYLFSYRGFHDRISKTTIIKL